MTNMPQKIHLKIWNLKDHSNEIKDLKNSQDAQDSEIAALKQLLASGAGDGVEIP